MSERYHLALCDDDLCPWKHAGLTGDAAAGAAQRHVVDVGHEVTLFDQAGKRVGRVVRVAEVRDGGEQLTFTRLGDVGPVHFQGGVICLQGHGCPGCGHGFWTEADDARRLAPGRLAPCPHCGTVRAIAGERAAAS